MPRTLSPAMLEQLHRLDGQAPIYLLEITHADLVAPVRVARWTTNVTHRGDVYIALAFQITPPDDLETSAPRASLTVDNVGRDLVQWLELSRGGAGARCRLIMVLEATPDTVEYQVDLALTNLQVTPFEVSAQLGFDDLINRPGVRWTHTPLRTPALF